METRRAPRYPLCLGWQKPGGKAAAAPENAVLPGAPSRRKLAGRIPMAKPSGLMAGMTGYCRFQVLTYTPKTEGSGQGRTMPPSLGGRVL